MRALGCVLLLGCTRDPLQAVCPAAGLGDLAITEIRGKQSPDDGLGQWIELFNTTSSTIDLEGVVLRIRKLDGTSEVDPIVRRTLNLASHAYAVLGLVEDQARPSYIDYGFASDYRESWLASAAIDVDACELTIDRVQYPSLPTTGTYSLGGDPSTDRNDLAPNWCTNPTAAGTPQQANPACP